MSKLFKLKEWLTVEEAAKHLSTVLGEEVAIADIYRLALDEHLVLSMNFPNKTYGNLGEAVGVENVKRFELPDEFLEFVNKGGLDKLSKEIVTSDYIGDGQFINWDEKVTIIDGVWDLVMRASEKIDVEFVYHQHIGGPYVDLVGLDGAFVKQGDVYCRLVESYDDNEYQKGSLATKKQLEKWIANNEVPEENIKPMWEKFDADRREYLAERDSRPRHMDYFPAGGLPKDGVYVVRTAAIVDFLNRINETPANEKQLSTKERNSLLMLIAALCKEAKYDLNKRGIAASLAKATEELGKPLSDDTIRGILKQVKNTLP